MAKHPNITPLQPSTKACLLMYGAPGVGKTKLLGTGGKGTLVVRPPTDHTDSIRTPGVEEWIVRRWDDMNEVEEYAHHEGKNHSWIWLDSISLFQDHGLEDIMEQTVARYPHRKNGPIDKGEYNMNFTRLASWCRHMVGIPGFNFGVTAHPAQIEDEATGETKMRPWVQGKSMSFKVMGMMNIVAYMEVVKQNNKMRRVLRFTATDDYDAKDQFDMFPNYRLVDPTMAKLEAGLKDSRPQFSKSSTRTTGARRTIKRKVAK